MRHDFACGGDFHDLVDATRVQEEGDLRAAGVYGVESGSGFAFVGEMGFGGHRLRSDTESRLEDSFVKENDIEFALERRNAWEKLV